MKFVSSQNPFFLTHHITWGLGHQRVLMAAAPSRSFPVEDREESIQSQNGVVLLDSRLPPLHVWTCQGESTEECASVLMTLDSCVALAWAIFLVVVARGPPSKLSCLCQGNKHVQFVMVLDSWESAGVKHTQVCPQACAFATGKKTPF